MQVATLTHAVSGIRPLELSPLYWLAVTFGNFLKTAALTLDSHHPWGPQGSDLGVRGHPTPRIEGTRQRPSRRHGRPAAPPWAQRLAQRTCPGRSVAVTAAHSLASGAVVPAGRQGDRLRTERASAVQPVWLAARLASSPGLAPGTAQVGRRPGAQAVRRPGAVTGCPVQGGEGTEAFPNKRECGWWPWCCSLAPVECRGNGVRGGGGTGRLGAHSV